MSNGKLFCSECIEETDISGYVESNGVTGTCSYCGKERNTVNVRWLAEKVEGIIEAYYQKTSHASLEYLRPQDAHECERAGNRVADVISELISKSFDGIAEDIRNVLEGSNFDRDVEELGEENPFDEEARYVKARRSSATLHKSWIRFINSIQTESRFFNETAKTVLSDIFDGIESRKTDQGKSVLRHLPPGSKLYRARIIGIDQQEEVFKQPDLQLGPPPSSMARHGRMNASGVSVFYGAVSEETAIAEVRPPVGALVALAGFDVIEEMHVLDLEALKQGIACNNYFSSHHFEHANQAEFLQMLCALCTRAVLPGDEEFKYLPTQVLAEHLANNPKVDGIAFPSVQSKGENIVLFHKFSRVEALTSDFKGDYDFFNECDILKPSVKRAETTSGFEDVRKPAIRIEVKSIKVVEAVEVQYKTADFIVICKEDE